MKPLCNIETIKGFKNKQGYFVYGIENEAVTILTKASGMSGAGGALYMTNNKDSDIGYRIRKLTPYECWVLMGFSEEDFVAAKVGDREKAKRLIEEYEPDRHLEMMQYIERKDISQMSNTQLYKQAGNSIVVDVLYYIYKNLYEAMPYLFDNLKLSSFFSGIGAFEAGLDRLYKDINVGTA